MNNFFRINTKISGKNVNLTPQVIYQKSNVYIKKASNLSKKCLLLNDKLCDKMLLQSCLIAKRTKQLLVSNVPLY